jgi:hypothetical protein
MDSDKQMLNQSSSNKLLSTKTSVLNQKAYKIDKECHHMSADTDL